jgi:RHS repeat-associated protein
MSYGLAGQLERVVTTTSNGSGTVTGRTRVDYRYTPQGIRTISVDWTDANLDGTFAAGERTGSVEYLIENANFTGYQQTILETVKNAAGQATKRITYTFGVDEITQTTTLPLPGGGEGWGEGETLTFAHDGKGSVRALFGAAAAIAQVFTYTAYGELLAIHNGSGTLQPLTSSLTSVLYNGEGLDARTGLYNMRARWYSASNARWERLDPFAGNPTDPFSFNKYGFVHGDPVQGIDPTGMFFSVGGFLMTAAFSGGLRSEANKVYLQIFGDVSAEANQHFGGYWRTIQLFSLASGVGIAGILSGRGMFQLLRSNGMLPSIQRGLAKMMPFLAKRATDFLERGVVLAGREVFERLSSGGQLAVREAYALRATSPNSRRNVAAMSYSIKDRAGNWVAQKPIADWSVGDVRAGTDVSLHSEQVLLKRIKDMHGTNFRVDAVFSERVPCTERHNCALVLADQEKVQGSNMELIHLAIDPGSGSHSSVVNAWQDLASSLGL